MCGRATIPVRMGRNGSFADSLYGSVSLAMARQAPCQVLLVPPAWPTTMADAEVRHGGAAAR